MRERGKDKGIGKHGKVDEMEIDFFCDISRVSASVKARKPSHGFEQRSDLCFCV